MNEIEINAESYTKAIEILEKNDAKGLLLNKNELVQAYKMRGMFYMQFEHSSEAIDDFNKAVDIVEDMRKKGNHNIDENLIAGVFAVRGSLFFMSSKAQLALQDLEKSIKIWESLLNKGLPIHEGLLEHVREIKTIMFPLLNEDENLKKSNQSYEKSNLANNYYCIAEAYMKREENSEAIINFNKCIELFSEIDIQQMNVDDIKTLSAAYLCRGNIYFQNDKNDSALDDYNKAIDIEELLQKKELEMDYFDTRHVISLYTNRAIVLESLEKEGAIDDFITALRLNKVIFDQSNNESEFLEKLHFSNIQESYYYRLDKLVDCLVKKSINETYFNDIIQEFLFSLADLEKTIKAKERENIILSKIRNYYDIKKANFAIKQGNEYYQKNMYNEAILEYTKSIALLPDDYTSYFNRGLVYGEKKEYSKAIEDFTETISFNHKHIDAFFWRGRCYLWSKDLDKAIADFTEVISMDPNNADAYGLRSDAYMEKEDNDKAIFDLTKFISFISNNPTASAIAYYNRGLAYARKELNEKALDDYTQAIIFDPNCAVYYFKRGKIYYDNREFDNAIADFEKTLQLDPSHTVGNTLLLGCYTKKMQSDRMSNIFNVLSVKKAVQDGDDFFEQKKFENAIEEYTYAIEKNPKNYELICKRGNAYYYNGNSEKAIDEFTRVIRLDPNNLDAYVSRGNVYCYIGCNELADADCAKVFEIDPNWANEMNKMDRNNENQSQSLQGRHAPGRDGELE